MYFALERVKTITHELNGYIYKDRIIIDKYQVKEGNYGSIQAVDCSGMKWQEFRRGEHWGGTDCHFWFRTKVKVPDEFDGKKAALLFYTGEPAPLSVDNDGWDVSNPQFILYVDGVLVQGLDINHREVTISEAAKRGHEYQIDLHAYSGKKSNANELFGELVIIDDNIRRLYYNLQVPVWVVENLREDDKRRIDILSVLNSTINLLDMRKPFSDLFYQSVDHANQFIEKELYEKMCGYEEAVATCIGHTHIDVAWLWTLAQTREKVARSFSTVLKLMDEYPEYVFMSSQPQLYKFIKEDHPEIYKRIKEKVKEGRWEPEGAMWLEADCNLSSGESLVRQILFGKRFFENEFGVKSEILWLPDVFGYTASLPQILVKSGIKYFMTTKINWNELDKFPYDSFMWRGLDGTEIFTYLITTRNPYYRPETHYTTYNGFIHPGAIMGGWERYQHKDLNNDILVAFGYGDGGGGPTREMLEAGRRMNKGIPGCPKIQIGKVGDYFKRLEGRLKNNKGLSKWVGELYLEYHRGTYTSVGRNKKYNRKSEFLYQDIEFLSLLAMGSGKEYEQEKINENWVKILLNQFHDILPGTSIEGVYEDSREQYEAVLDEGRIMIKDAMDAISYGIQLRESSIVVFNTLSFERSDVAVFDMPEDYTDVCIKDENGNNISFQNIVDNGRRKGMFVAEGMPPKGYKAFSMMEGTEKNDNFQDERLNVCASELSNRFFYIKIDECGTISSLYDRINNREVLKHGERGNKLQVFEDKPFKYDNWNIENYYQEKMWEVNEIVNIEVIENGPVRGGIRIHKKFLDSTIIQNIYIYNDIPRIDFDTYIDWRHSQLLLKAAFPVDIHADKATYDIQFGNVERSTHKNTSWDIAQYEVCAHKWADLSEDGFGVSLMNDCKYGYDIKDSTMRLTLLKSGIYPCQADQGEHRFVYSIYPHKGNWKEGNTVEMAYSLNVPLYTKIENAHDGTLPPVLSMIWADKENVIIDTIKKAEDSDDIIVRVYECNNRRCDVCINFYIKLEEVWECDLLENELTILPVDVNSFTFQIMPYEIKTFKLMMRRR